MKKSLGEPLQLNGRQILIWTVISTPILLFATIFLMGGGHGTYIVARLLYPIPMIIAAINDGITYLTFYLAVIQFPLYGLIIYKARKTIWKRVILIIILLHFLLFFTILSCGVNDKNIDNNLNEIQIQEITQMPEDIEGCACYLSRNDMAFNQGKHIYASNNDSTCYMMLNEELIRLKMKSTTLEPFVFKNQNSIEHYISDNYEVLIKSNFEDSTSFESWKFHGEIVVKAKNGRESKVNFVGACGC